MYELISSGEEGGAGRNLIADTPGHAIHIVVFELISLDAADLPYPVLVA